MDFPAHPFWDFSLAFYRRPGVADACVYLQDRFGMNVNLLLFCVWLAQTGRGALDRGQVEAALRRISDWQVRVVEPLRSIRRACRREPLGIPEFLLEACLPHIEAAELEAEHVEQLVLAELAGHRPAAAGREPAADAQDSFAAIVAALDLKRSEPLDQNLAAILGAAFGTGRAAGS